MERKIETRTEHSVEIREEIIPEGFVILESYVPSSCPWDYYGMRWSHERLKVLANAGLTEGGVFKINKKHLAPMGSGPGGKVRFGDNMMPSTYRLCVPTRLVEKAQNALFDHKIAINEWLHHGGKMPEACR